MKLFEKPDTKEYGFGLWSRLRGGILSNYEIVSPTTLEKIAKNTFGMSTWSMRIKNRGGGMNMSKLRSRYIKKKP